VATQLLEPPVEAKPAVTAKQPSKLNLYLGLLTFGFLFFAIALRGRSTLPLDRSTLTPFHVWLNNVSAWIDTNRDSNPIFTSFVNVIRGFISGFVTFIQNMISQTGDTRSIPQIGWLGVVAIIGFVVYAISNIRIATFAVAGFISLGLLGLWQESMDTLALTLAAVTISLLVGIPLGIYYARS
jgi:glycine betaine/proline transport system permease protein